MWLKLVAVIPKDYLSLIDNAKTEVDFFVNCLVSVVICVLYAAILYSISFYAATPIGPLENIFPILIHTKWYYVVISGALLVLGWFLYLGAIDRTRAWGEFVKSAFDLFLPDLAKQLGYDLPRTTQKRKEFWEAVNSMFLDLDPVNSEYWSTQAQEPPPWNPWLPVDGRKGVEVDQEKKKGPRGSESKGAEPAQDGEGEKSENQENGKEEPEATVDDRGEECSAEYEDSQPEAAN
jgi:hypothetical protein